MGEVWLDGEPIKTTHWSVKDGCAIVIEEKDGKRYLQAISGNTTYRPSGLPFILTKEKPWVRSHCTCDETMTDNYPSKAISIKE